MVPPSRAGFRVVAVDWGSEEAEHALGLRFRVFVDEQKVPPEEEIDAIDPLAWHVVAVDQGDGVIGTGRCFRDDRDSELGHIGRMAVAPEWRGRGVGLALLAALVERLRNEGLERATLSAQCHAIAFYERMGFIAEGDEYDDCGIPHRRMNRLI